MTNLLINDDQPIINQKHFYVYIYRHPITSEPIYVGKGSGKRKRIHISKSHNLFLTNMILKIKREYELEPTIEIIKTTSEDEAFELEMSLIIKYGRRQIDTNGILANRTLGGEGPSGRIMSNETKSKLSKAKTGIKIHTEESKRKISEANKGKTLSLESRKKVSEANKGKILSEETKKKVGIASKGRRTNLKTWNIQNPSGEILEVKDLIAFCKNKDFGYKVFLQNSKHSLPITKGKAKGWNNLGFIS